MGGGGRKGEERGEDGEGRCRGEKGDAAGQLKMRHDRPSSGQKLNSKKPVLLAATVRKVH